MCAEYIHALCSKDVDKAAGKENQSADKRTGGRARWRMMMNLLIVKRTREGDLILPSLISCLRRGDHKALSLSLSLLIVVVRTNMATCFCVSAAVVFHPPFGGCRRY